MGAKIVIEKEWGEWRVMIEGNDGEVICDVVPDEIEVEMDDNRYLLSNIDKKAYTLNNKEK